MGTKDKIRKAVTDLLYEHSLDEMSVKMVCMEADISKQTLYNNYYGIYAVVEEIVLEMLEETASEYPGANNCREQLKAQIRMMTADSLFFTHIFCSKYRDELIDAVRAKAEPQIQTRVLQYIGKTGAGLTEREMNIVTAFYTDIFVCGLRRFANMRFEDDPDEAINIISSLVRGQMQTAVTRIGNVIGTESA